MTKRGTKLITILVAVIMSATFLLTCFSVFGAFLNKEEGKANSTDENVLDLGDIWEKMTNDEVWSSDIEPNKYITELTNADSYEIRDYNGWAAFSYLTTYDNKEQSKAMSEKDGTKKTVNLMVDLDLSPEAVKGKYSSWENGGYQSIGDDDFCTLKINYGGGFFAGNFDGNGHTIKNIKMTSGYFAMDDDPMNTGSRPSLCGLFTVLEEGSTIKNLQVDSIYLDLPNLPNGDGAYANRYFIGGLVAYSKCGIIENCAVTNFTIKQPASGICEYWRVDASQCGYGNSHSNAYYVGGIYAVGKAKISNCYVGRMTGNGAESFVTIGPATSDFMTWYYPHGYHNGYKYHLWNGGHNPYTTENSEYVASYESIVVKDIYNLDKPVTDIAYNADIVGANYCKSEDDVKSYYSDDEYSEGGEFDGNNYWYRNLNYNSGWPSLRIFIRGWNGYRLDFDSSKCNIKNVDLVTNAESDYNGEALYGPDGRAYGGFTNLLEELNEYNSGAYEDESGIIHIKIQTLILSVGIFKIKCNEGYILDDIVAEIHEGEQVNYILKVIVRPALYNFVFYQPTLLDSEDSVEYTISLKDENGTQTGLDRVALENIEYDSTLELTSKYEKGKTIVQYKFANQTVTYVFDGIYGLISFSDRFNQLTADIDKVPYLGYDGRKIYIYPTIKLKQYNINWG